MQQLNSVNLIGNLTRDPEIRTLPSGTSICRLRLGSETRRRTGTGTWEAKRNYFDVLLYGAQADNAAKFLSKGRPVAVSGRLESREWEKDGAKREKVEIVADTLQFLGGGPREQTNGNGAGSPAREEVAQ